MQHVTAATTQPRARNKTDCLTNRFIPGRDALYDADLVGHVERVVVGSQPHVGLLLSIGPDERVDFGHIDVIQLLHSRLDLVLVGPQVDDEHQRVVILDLLHRRLRCQRVLDDGELIETGPPGHAPLRVLGLAGQRQSLGATELDRRADLFCPGPVSSLDYLSSGGHRLGAGLCLTAGILALLGSLLLFGGFRCGRGGLFLLRSGGGGGLLLLLGFVGLCGGCGGFLTLRRHDF
ncbi:unnamed protein product [Ixodes pacificus]